MVSMAVVPCKVPRLFSKPVLSGLGMVYHVSERKVDLKAMGLEAISVKSGRTGHPVLPTSQFSKNRPPVKGVPDYDVVWCPLVTAYMLTQSGQPPESQLLEASPTTPGPRLFYPKKIPTEVRDMLVGEWGLGGHAYMAWWNGANQSRDFWVETDEELVRIHVVPRKHRFDPSQWTTQHSHLKDALLERLGATRITEAIPCLAEGVLVKCLSKALKADDASTFSALGLCGSAIAASASIGQGSLCPPGPQFELLMPNAPLASLKQKSPWKMLKVELMDELGESDVLVYPKWTVRELRSMVVRQRPRTKWSGSPR